MVKKDKQNEAAQEVKRITDYVEVGMQQFEGEKIKMVELLGQDMKLLDFAAVVSKQSEPDEAGHRPNFLVMQVEVDGKVFVTTCGAAQPVRAIEQMPKQYLPCWINIYEETNPETKRRYYAIK